MKNEKRINKALMSFGILGVVVLLGMGMVFAYQGDPNVKGPDYSEERHEAMEEAFETLDYNAWVSLMTESGRHSRVVEVVTANNFGEFVEAHEAMEDGNMELARELRAELGLGQGRMAGNNGKGLRDGSGLGQGKGMKQESRLRQGNCLTNPQ